MIYIIAVSSIQQLHHPINEIIFFLSFDWSSGQLDESITNNNQSEDRKSITSLVGWRFLLNSGHDFCWNIELNLLFTLYFFI